jgi:hypothetical protein
VNKKGKRQEIIDEYYNEFILTDDEEYDPEMPNDYEQVN